MYKTNTIDKYKEKRISHKIENVKQENVYLVKRYPNGSLQMIAVLETSV